MKKVFLDIGFDYDFVLYSIVSQETPHRLVWFINKAIQSRFARAEDLILTFEEGEELCITRFSFHDELNHLEFNLFSNRDTTGGPEISKPFLQQAGYWLPELRKMDYFIMVKGALDSFHKRKFTEPFKKIQAIQIISEINHKKLKQKERLIF